MVKGYRSTFNHVFYLVGINLAANSVISMKFSSYEKSIPPREIQALEWNLSLVLQSLSHLPYNTVKVSLDKYLTWKNFLLALTLAKRVSEFSELHSLSHRVSH